MIDRAFKDQLREAARQAILQKLQRLESAQAELKADLQSASKSSAGDKHETSRAMLHLEQEKLSKQAQQWQAQMRVLTSLPSHAMKQVAPGALLQLDGQLFYIGPALGKLVVGNRAVYCLSGGAPLARALQGLQPGARIDRPNGSQSLEALI